MSTVLIVPGLHGSGPQHWQSWFESQLPGAVRVEQSDWETPYLPRWAGAVRRELDRANGHVWIVAHSFGCLASAHAAWDFRDRIAGVMFVAPADPDKFGVREMLPDQHLGFPSVVVASTNDPWVRLMKAAYLAERWGSHFINVGAAGHINIDSGFGPWPEGLRIFEQLRQTQSDLPLGRLDAAGSAGKSVRKNGNAPRRGGFNWMSYLGEAS
ncbi:RBBP9/YdeN family alpha/beta hydrolase [Uliginosibacterium sp. sgz301328]|uniref:RBBP9/YdeN family alpha/beta hydrolase n=1 Tax=Uliginosibacterium sp. sgz301328 TaxID=3243764 RepID=UPI00359CE0AE